MQSVLIKKTVNLLLFLSLLIPIHESHTDLLTRKLQSIKSITWFSTFSQIVFFEGKCFMGRRLVVFGDSENFQDRGFMNKVNSIRVESGAWVCFDHPDFKGQQYMLEKGEYPDFQRWNAHNDHMGSCKPIKMVRMKSCMVHTAKDRQLFIKRKQSVVCKSYIFSYILQGKYIMYVYVIP